MVTYTEKLYNHTIPNKGSQVIDSPASTFEGLGTENRYRWSPDEAQEYDTYRHQAEVV